MSLRFTDRPYGGARDARTQVDKTISRLPQGVQSMNTAPMATSQTFIIYDASATPHYAMHHHNQWVKVRPFKDGGGVTRWQMSGEPISQPIAWKPR
jgi:hypothetical protein